MISFWANLFSFIPSTISVYFAGLVVVFLVFLGIRIVTLILDALPFL